MARVYPLLHFFEYLQAKFRHYLLALSMLRETTGIRRVRMISASLHPMEQERLDDLIRYEVLDTESELAFDDLTRLASALCDTPISLISLVDDHRQWFKSKVGLDAEQTDKGIAFCSHAILQDNVFEVPNALKDERFFDNPLVSGAPDIRFYAGAPLVTPQGHPIGTLCVIDTESKKLSEQQTMALEILAKQVISQLELRLHNRRLQRINQDRECMITAISHDLKSPFNVILGLSKRLSERADTISSDKLADVSKSILASSMQAYQLLDEMLQWSQSRMGDVKLNLRIVDLKALVNSATEILESASSAKSIQINNHIQPNQMVTVDPTLIKTVLRNLITNAIKYSPDHSHVDVQAEFAEDFFQVSVTDQGNGISSQLCDKLFDDVVDSAESTTGELGHGLGLRLSGEFVRAHNGKIWVEQGYLTGARIIVQLPVNASPSATK